MLVVWMQRSGLGESVSLNSSEFLLYRYKFSELVDPLLNY